MKICLNCETEYQNKREASKFCSPKCRVMYNRKNPKNTVTKLQMQVLYNQFLEAVGKMGSQPFETRLIPPLSKKEEVAMFNYEHKDQLTTISELPTFQDLLNGMEGLLFGDEKDDYAHKIKAANHLSDKQRNLLLANLRQLK